MNFLWALELYMSRAFTLCFGEQQTSHLGKLIPVGCKPSSNQDRRSQVVIQPQFR